MWGGLTEERTLTLREEFKTTDRACMGWNGGVPALRYDEGELY